MAEEMELKDGEYVCAKGHLVSAERGTEYVNPSTQRRQCYVCIKEHVAASQARGQKLWDERHPSIVCPDFKTRDRFMRFLVVGRRHFHATTLDGKKHDLGPCWLWHGAMSSRGYGVFSLRGAKQRAHEVAWLWVRKSLPSDRGVLKHMCDIRRCVNPAHLVVVERKDGDDDSDTDERLDDESIRAALGGEGEV